MACGPPVVTCGSVSAASDSLGADTALLSFGEVCSRYPEPFEPVTKGLIGVVVEDSETVGRSSFGKKVETRRVDLPTVRGRSSTTTGKLADITEGGLHYSTVVVSGSHWGHS